MPWPTLQDMSGAWTMNCIVKDDQTSVQVEAQIDKDGNFKIREYFHLNQRCAGYAVDLRTRSGTVTAIEAFVDGAQRVDVHLHEPYQDGDMMNAEAIISKTSDSGMQIRPLKAEYFGLSHKRIRLWEGQPDDMMTLRRLTDASSF